ncbi:MAG: efflux RND transporter periplasmic adaptor subunit [Vicinamibacterales bacterium]
MSERARSFDETRPRARGLADLLSVALFCLAAAAWGCGGGKSEAHDAVGDSHGEAGHGEAAELKIPPPLQEKWGIKTAPVSRTMISSTVTLPGVVTLDQTRTAQISPLLEGRVTEIRTDLGRQVRRNQVLAIVHAPAFADDQAAYLQAHATRSLAKREYERARELLQAEAIQEKEYLRRQADFEAATTEFALRESRLHSLGMDHAALDRLVARTASGQDDLSDIAEPFLEITSPIDGRVIFRDVVLGEYVDPGKLLFTVSDLTRVWAVLDAREKDLPHVASSSSVSLRSDVYPDKTFAGRNPLSGDVVDEKLRTMKIRVEVANTGLLLKPNMYVRGVVETKAAAREVLVVPDEAVQTIGGEPRVFVASPGGVFTARPVKLGERVGGRQIVIGGLDGTEMIVVAGAFTLKSEVMKSSLEGGHSH